MTSVIHTGTTSHTHVVGVVTKPNVVVTHPKPSVQPKPHLTRPHHGPVHHVPSRPGKQVKPLELDQELVVMLEDIAKYKVLILI